MAQKGLTKKQFRIELAVVAFWELYAVFWIVTGIVEKKASWIMGAILGVLYAAYAIYLFHTRKHHPVEDPGLDKQLDNNFKTGMTGMGIILLIITVGFLIAFGLAALLK